MPTCIICGVYQKDLSQHIRNCHSMSVQEYHKVYNQSVVEPSIEEKRKSTCLERYGNPNYKNEEAKKLSNEIYQGGHSLRDPVIRDKGKKTKMELYGDPNFTNRDKAKKTCLEKYGKEYTCQVPEVIVKRVQTLKERYGRVFNVDRAHNKKDPPEEFSNEYLKGTLMEDLCKIFKVSECTIRRWVKEKDLKRSINVSSSRVFCSSREAVAHYLETCSLQNKVLSFYEYGKINSIPNMLKMKRLFNAGKKYNNLREELFRIASFSGLHTEFLNKFE